MLGLVASCGKTKVWGWRVVMSRRSAGEGGVRPVWDVEKGRVVDDMVMVLVRRYEDGDS